MARMALDPASMMNKEQSRMTMTPELEGSRKEEHGIGVPRSGRSRLPHG
jgi:hypothetical protein